MSTVAPTADEAAPPTLGAMRSRLDQLARSGAPGMRGFAAWLADRPEELAFHSVRSLAELAGADPNVVVRCMKAAGFSGYAAARRAVQDALRHADQGYVGRADALGQIDQETLLQALCAAAQANARRVYAPDLCKAMEDVVPHLLGARRVYCVGARMAYSLAHYFTYRGAIAHENIMPAPAHPGLIFDRLLETGPEDVVILISFAHYSAEVLRAAEVVRKRGARLLALTDRRDSPLARDAWRVIIAPTEGPNVMHSILGAMMIIEALLELMTAADSGAKARVDAFEKGLLELGAYVPIR